jgi:hypothetical protein
MRKLLTVLMAAVILMAVVVAPASAGTCAIFRSWNNGDQLTASDLTTSFTTTGQTNMIPTCMTGDSPNVAGMQANQDPYNNGAGPESLAIDIKGELERMRFVLKKLTGWPQWYRYDQPLVFPTGGGTSTFTAIAVTNNTNEIALGTTNIGTMTLAGGALTGARTWTWPDITGIVALTNGGQTFTSGVWNGSIIGTVYGGTGLDTHTAANGTLLIGNGSGWAAPTTLTAGAGVTITNGAGTITVAAGAGVPNGTSTIQVNSTTQIQLNVGVIPLKVGGVFISRPITSAVTISNGGLAASTVYFVYAADSSGTILELSTTGHATDTTFGVETKSGDATRTLVGMVRTNGSTQFVDSGSQRFLISWFNRGPKTSNKSLVTDRTTTAGTATELSSADRVEFLAWAGAVLLTEGGAAANSGAANSFTTLGADGSSSITGAFMQGTTFQNASISGQVTVAEGYHFASVFGAVSAGTGTWGWGTVANGFVSVLVQG